MFRVVVRAYNKDDYSKDILIMDEEQVRMQDVRLSTRPGYSGMFIDPEEFPEMVRFEVIIQSYPNR